MLRGMLDSTAPIPLDYQLPADAYRHLIRTLRRTLPPPPGDSPDDLQKRDHAAIACVAALAPGNAAEGKLAARFVAASEHSDDCLRHARTPETTPEWAAKCRAQALGMMREANSALRLLLRMQEARRKLEADHVACDRAARAEHVAIALMAEALAQPASSPAVAATPPEPQPSEPRIESGASEAPAKAGAEPAAAVEEPSPAGRGQGEGTEPAPFEEPDTQAEAEHYAILYPERAALIRRLGRLPDDPSFGPPDDDLVRALIAGGSPALAALDRAFAEAQAA